MLASQISFFLDLTCFRHSIAAVEQEEQIAMSDEGEDQGYRTIYFNFVTLNTHVTAEATFRK